MCGITGYLGHREAYPIVMNGLQRLEYRGYDSAGIVLSDGENWLIYKPLICINGSIMTLFIGNANKFSVESPARCRV